MAKVPAGLAAFSVAAYLCAAPSPAAAGPADDVLMQVEDHCIQPGRTFQEFLETPSGWDRVPAGDVRAQFAIAALTIAPWYGIDRSAESDRAEVEADIAEGIEKEINRDIEDFNNGEGAVFRHRSSGTMLAVETDGRGWFHMSCTLWPSAENEALQRAILARWTLPIPRAKTSPFGTLSEVSINIRRNGVPGRVSGDVYRVPPDVGPVPLYLELTLLPL